VANDQAPPAILLIGATGRLGSRVARGLAGRPNVRALARSDASAAKLTRLGVEAVRGDLDDPGSLAAAMAGVQRLFLVTPFGDDQRAQEGRAVRAAQEAGVRRVVKISSESIRVAGEDDPDPIAVVSSHLEVERDLNASAMEAVALRPTFITHLFAGQRAQIAEGAFALPFGTCEMALVHPQDVADAAVAALTADAVEPGPWHLTGPEALTFAQMAERIGAVAGHAVSYVPIANSTWLQGAIAAGLPPDFAAGLAGGFQLYAERPHAEVTDDVERLTGHRARTLEDYVRDELRL
jgi:uncharacterized protein YbjT (DUF2867 family)